VRSRALIGFLVGLAAFVVPVPRAAAAELVTDYPSVVVQPGQTSTFPIEVRARSVERVGLAVTGVPEGWRAVLRGGGQQVGAVYTDPAAPTTVQLEVDVPPGAPPGPHRVVVRADAPSGDDELALDLVVSEQAAAAFELRSEFDQLQGSPSDTFTFDLELENRSAAPATFNLTAAAPEGWSAKARPTAEQQASTVTVDAGKTEQLQVEVDPPDNVAADTYPIRVQAASAQQSLEKDLKVQIVGTAELTLGTANERLDVSGGAGDATEVRLVVRNEGSAPLTDVSFDATPPTDWEVSFEPEQVDVVEPGGSVAVKAVIEPTGDAVAGDYVVTLTANGASASDSVDIRFAVEASTAWGVAGVAVIAVAIGVLFWLFRRFGRR
jgi:uncharacterized membrane protein